MIWATVTILTPCSAENFSRSGTRAIVPSAFMISQMTPAGLRPASRERSTAASVWPARCRTPPGRARKGKTWPGMTRSSGSVASSTATLHVCARSAAEMPVETPSLASMETVKAVPMREELWVIICGISRRSRISSAIEADEPPAVGRHEVYVLGGYELGGHGQVALVLAILVVADDDHLPRLDVLDDLFHRTKRHLRRSSPGLSRLLSGVAQGAAPRILLRRPPPNSPCHPHPAP